MNANKLADELDSCDEYEMVEFVRTAKVATMLRQQQEKLTKYELRNEEQRNRIARLEAKTELTDEEITAIWQTDECYQKAQNFARAILKKSGEK